LGIAATEVDVDAALDDRDPPRREGRERWETSHLQSVLQGADRLLGELSQLSRDSLLLTLKSHIHDETSLRPLLPRDPRGAPRFLTEGKGMPERWTAMIALSDGRSSQS
jgi:hypothetical protein